MEKNLDRIEIVQTVIPLPTVPMFGLPIANIDSQTASQWIIDRALSRTLSKVQFINAHCCNVSVKNARYKKTLLDADLLLPDGSGIATAMKMRDEELVENLNGTDFIPILLQAARAEKLSVFLLGGLPGIAEKAGEKFKSIAPGLNIVGCLDGFFSVKQTRTVIETINDASPDFLLVGFGVPAQELWIEKYAKDLNSTVNIGVGGLFDYYAGRIPRAPRYFRKNGVEWIWRLAMEPGRMWRRYLLGNPLFLLRAWRDSRSPTFDTLPMANPNKLSATLTPLRWWFRRQSIPIHKRGLDILLSTIGLVLLLPLFTVVALAIKLESKGPVLFRQVRVGNRGAEFKLWKFRSMYQDAEKRRKALEAQNEMAGGVIFKMRHDPRVTTVGRLIRRLSIDELPQLWNVLIGDMSLVGPRPALPSEVEAYPLDARNRLLGKPGITGIWQVSGRSEIPFPRQVEMDLEYLDQACATTDIKLLAKTLPAIIDGRGAY